MNNNNEVKQGDAKRQNATPPSWRFWLLYIGIALVFLWVWQAFQPYKVESIPYSAFRKYLAAGDVVQVAISNDEIQGQIKSDPHVAAGLQPHEPASPTSALSPWLPQSMHSNTTKPSATEHGLVDFQTTRVEDPSLVPDLLKAKVQFVGVRPSLLSQFLWSWVLPLGLIFLLWSLVLKRFKGPGASVLSFTKNKAKLMVDKDTGVTFNDVAGCDEAKHELQEIVQFLREPKRFEALGAKIPKGVLLVGPPGTGKTLLARAVAGEAHVPFYSMSGSDFVEIFVGLGAARVRDLFEQAKNNASCIIFIDEIDTIGRHRGVTMGVANDEREQTLNQLLSEMDGFEPNVGIILLAATNRPEVLDRALLRPGRFDRQVVVDAPDINGRVAILKVHTRGKPLAPQVDLRRIAQATPGFSGADLANTVNEAALLAARAGRTFIAQRDLEDAIEKVVAGPERRSRRLAETEKRRVAFHETGHALVALYCEHADPVHKISIVPRGRAALGYTMQLPEGDTFLQTRSELMDRIRGLLGGRAAEELTFGEVSTGAENDLEKATALAQQMVCLYGMGKSVGLAHFGQRGRPVFLPGGDEVSQRETSPETAREIDKEVRDLLARAYDDARRILIEHRDQLERVGEELLQRETIDATELRRLTQLGSVA